MLFNFTHSSTLSGHNTITLLIGTFVRSVVPSKKTPSKKYIFKANNRNCGTTCESFEENVCGVNLAELKLYNLFSTAFLFQKKGVCCHSTWLIIYKKAPKEVWSYQPKTLSWISVLHNTKVVYWGWVPGVSDLFDK